MSSFESSDPPFIDRNQFEISKEHLTAEEECLTALFDMADVDKIGAYQPRSEFFVAMNGYDAPDGLGTNIHVRLVDVNQGTFNAKIFPAETEVIATVSVGFVAQYSSWGLHNIDFVQTDDGIKAYKKDWYTEEGERIPEYVRLLDESQLTALSADAKQITQTIMDMTAERLRLGPLSEEAGPDGLRRFHVGDILSILADKLVSPRGVEGLYDILQYMTKDMVYSTQLGRFIDECKPYLHKQFDQKLAVFYEPSKEAVADPASGYRWLGEVTQTIGASLLTVEPIPDDQHAVIDVYTEIELDHGSEAMNKIITFKPDDPEEK